jgi:lysozyme
MRRKLRQREEILKRQKGLTFSMLSQYRQAVLIDMSYQLGVTGVLRFTKMWSAIAAGHFKTAAAEMLDSLWARQTPARAKRLAFIMEHDRFAVE